MATGYAIKWLKDKLGVKFFPVTHIKAVRNDNNINLETLLSLKQDELVSGTNIKTVNNTSILGSGNIEVPVPTKTSDLTNDSGFITSADIPEGSAASTTVPLMDGTASTGTEMAFARGDHRHPSDTSKLDVISDLETIRSGALSGATAYHKPSGGIPKTDLATAVLTSLEKADSALQSFTETDPVFAASAAFGISSTDITNWNNKSTFSGSYNDLTNKPTIPSAPGTLKTNATTAQTASASESLSGNITLHKISKTGTYSDLIGKPTIPTKVSDLTNDSNFTSNTGTITSVKTTEGAHTTINISSGVVSFNVPTKTSHLTNDSGFITTADIPEGAAASTTTPLMDGTAAIGTELAFARGDHRHPTDTSRLAVISDLATIRSGASAGATAYQKPSTGIPASDIAAGVIPDVSNFITKSVNDLTNYYTKSLTYTQDEVLQLVNAIKLFTYESVSSLPTASASTMNKIYLVPSSNPDTLNIKDEYITIQSGSTYSWEQIGSTAIDLSGYVTTTALNTTLADYVTNSSLSTSLSGYQTKITSTNKLDYSLLSNTPTIPAELVNSDWNAVSGKALILNKPTIPDISTKQDTLVSGTNIKTINGETLLGEGNVELATNIPEINHGTSDTTFLLTPNVMHIWGEVSSLTLTLPTDTNEVLDEFMFTFTSGSTPTTLSLPSSIKWMHYLSVEANKTYQVSIINGLAGYMTENMNTASVPIESISVNGIEQSIVDSNVDITIPTKTSDLTNDSGYLTLHLDISGKADKATTLAGYGITDAKIANGVITLGSNSITPLTSFTESDPVFTASAAHGITSSDISNWNSKTSNVGTITGITMNGASKGTSGVVDLGTVITAHQDISGKADKTATVSTVTYDSTNKKITKTINGVTTDVVTAAQIVADGGSSSVTFKVW